MANTYIKLLPALPDDWNFGKIENVLCRGGMIGSVEWDGKEKAYEAVIISPKTQEIWLGLPWTTENTEWVTEPKEVQVSKSSTRIIKWSVKLKRN